MGRGGAQSVNSLEAQLEMLMAEMQTAELGRPKRTSGPAEGLRIIPYGKGAWQVDCSEPFLLLQSEQLHSPPHGVQIVLSSKEVLAQRFPWLKNT